MHNKIKAKTQQIVKNPATRKVFMSMKPAKTIWGFVGVILFFIAPEIIAFIWGSDITHFAQVRLAMSVSVINRQYYELLVMLFKDGGSWINLTIGFALLIWLFF